METKDEIKLKKGRKKQQPRIFLQKCTMFKYKKEMLQKFGNIIKVETDVDATHTHTHAHT